MFGFFGVGRKLWGEVLGVFLLDFLLGKLVQLNSWLFDIRCYKLIFRVISLCIRCNCDVLRSRKGSPLKVLNLWHIVDEADRKVESNILEQNWF